MPYQIGFNLITGSLHVLSLMNCGMHHLLMHLEMVYFYKILINSTLPAFSAEYCSGS